jgi:acyl-CoA thioester hydrolase
METTAQTGVRATVTRRIDWQDTDAAGIYHYSTVLRLSEAAEAELHRDRGIGHMTFGYTPRVHIEFDFKRPVAFDDEVVTELVVSAIGRTSVTYDLVLSHDGQLVATGRIVSVFLDRCTRLPAPWPAEVRAALTA